MLYEVITYFFCLKFRWHGKVHGIDECLESGIAEQWLHPEESAGKIRHILITDL